jgi:YidC/Oxa1 family membrane protein insertase
MLPPEVLRIVLLIGLAATGYLMMLAWSEDQQQARAPVEYSDAPSVAGDLSPDLAPSLVPPAQPSTQSDVPDDSLLGDASVVSKPVPTGTAAAARLVKVTTKALNVWLDLEGGDIVRVQLIGYPVALDQPDTPYQLLERGATRVYVAQSGLIGKDGPDGAGRPVYQADQPEYAFLDAPGRVTLSTEFRGSQIRKIYEFDPEEHLLNMRYEMDNRGVEPLQAAMFAQIKRDSQPPSMDEAFSLAPQPFLGAAITTPEERYLKVDFEDIDETVLDERVEGGWVAFLQHYFLSAWVSPPTQPNRFYGRKGSDGRYLFGFTGPLTTVEPGQTGVWESQFYAGPKDQKRLEEIADNLNLTIDYGFLWWLAMPLFFLLDWLHGLVGNWGIAIILLTVVVKAVLYPLSAAGYKSMANMRRVAPQLKKIQERYANDREKLSREMMALYKKENANPLGGCLPMLLPMPIFIALYWVLFESVELRQAPFMFWIDDLAQMDPYFILPLLMGASTYWMQSLNPQVGDPMQQKMMKMMPIMFTVLFLFFPAGLVLYWLMNNLISVAQQQYVYKRAEKAQAN